MKRGIALVAGFGLAGVLGVIVFNVYVLARAGGATGDVTKVRRAQVAIVPGALVQPGGRMSAMLADRVARAAELYRAGKVARILVSGDHGGAREVLARVKGFQQGTLKPRVLLGPAHPISGDGRGSWGPADPLAP